MTITNLVTLAENRLAAINQAIASATRSGNAEELARLEGEADETQSALDSLRAIP